jgi:DNA polymerase
MAEIAELMPSRRSLPALRGAAARCTACPLWRPATQTVFGAGTRTAELMMVGEQPGDREDEQGVVFVGPAGRELDAALAEAGIERRRVYLTNAVKHFKFEQRGKRRIHQKPNPKEIAACRPWLDAELDVVRPRALCLLGREFRVTRERGRVFVSEFAELTMATVHPSSILRSRDKAERVEARRAFTEDLETLAQAMR